MGNETQAALATLAAKLGTTTEYLWGVLLKQASVAGITDLVQYALIVLAAMCLRKISPKLASAADGHDPEAFLAFLSLALGWTVIGILSIAAFFQFPHTVAAFINPEYWALREVMSALGK